MQMKQGTKLKKKIDNKTSARLIKKCHEKTNIREKLSLPLNDPG